MLFRSLHSLLAIGGHDLDKIGNQIEFTVSQKEDVFLPILSKEKHVSPTDYVYRDEKGILAWLDVRDSENYKFDDNTKNAIFIKASIRTVVSVSDIKRRKTFHHDGRKVKPS